MTRRALFEEDWQRRLNYLVSDVHAVTFDEAWQSTLEVMRQVEVWPGRLPHSLAPSGPGRAI